MLYQCTSGKSHRTSTVTRTKPTPKPKPKPRSQCIHFYDRSLQRRPNESARCYSTVLRTQAHGFDSRFVVRPCAKARFRSATWPTCTKKFKLNFHSLYKSVHCARGFSTSAIHGAARKPGSGLAFKIFKIFRPGRPRRAPVAISQISQQKRVPSKGLSESVGL